MKIPKELQERYDRIMLAEKSFREGGFSKQKQTEFNKVLDSVLDELTGKGLVPGRIVFIPHNDGNAVYMVAQVGERTTTLLHLDIGDGWHSPVVSDKGTAPTKTIRAIVERADAVSDLFQERIDQEEVFYKEFPLGKIVHRHDSFGQFIRYQVVMGQAEGMDKPGKCLKPIALVGEWKPYYVFTVNRFGEINHGYHAKKILDGELVRVLPSNLHEIKPDPRYAHLDLAKLPALSLYPPPFTDQEQQSHQDWLAVKRALEILNVDGKEHDPVVLMQRTRDTITTYLKNRFR